MEPRWFWRSAESLYGPLSTDEVAQLIRRKRISDTDELRIDDEGEWMAASSIKALLDVSEEARSAHTASDSAAHVLKHAASSRLSYSGAGSAKAPLTGRLVACAGYRLAAFIAYLPCSVRAGALFINRLRWLLNRKLTLAVLAVFLLAVVFKDRERSDWAHQETLVKLSTVWEHSQSLRERSASAAEWRKFAEQTFAWLKPTLETLEQETHEDPVSAQFHRNLLSFGRGVEWILEDPSSRDDAVLAGLDQMHGYLTADPALVGSPHAVDRTDYLTAGLLTFDVLALCGVACVWMRRWRSRA